MFRKKLRRRRRVVGVALLTTLHVGVDVHARFPLTVGCRIDHELLVDHQGRACPTFLVTPECDTHRLHL